MSISSLKFFPLYVGKMKFRGKLNNEIICDKFYIIYSIRFTIYE